MGDNGTLWLPEGGSTLAGEIDALFYFVYWTSVIIFVGVIGTMVYFAYRYRRRSEADRPRPVHENKLVEASWIIVPTILVLIVFTWGFQAFLKLGVAPPNAYQVSVRGWKWGWEFTYPTGETSNELHVPVNRPVRLQMISSDVLHSFFVPAFRVKHDVLPNRYTWVWFEATRQDTFQVSCTEYCGTGHSDMLTYVVAQSQGDFNAWLQGLRVDTTMSPVERGEVLYTQKTCNACHSLDGSIVVGPSFQGLFGSPRAFSDGTTATADENYLREAILQPNAKIVQGFQGIMPNFGLSEEEVTALVAFIEAQQ